MKIGGFIRCPNCEGVLPYHTSSCSGATPLPYQPPPATLTEADVRRIVREELRMLLEIHDQAVLNIPEFLRTKT